MLYVKSVAADGYTNADAGKFAQSDAFKYSESGAAEEKTVTFDLTANEEFDTWDSGYTQRTLTYDAAKIVFAEANKQSSGAAITDCPVTKGKDIQIILNNSKAKITAITITLKKWGSKTQTATLYYSTDGGTTYTATTTKSSAFVLSSKNLPESTNAVKVTFSSKSNQVGCQKIEMTYVE